MLQTLARFFGLYAPLRQVSSGLPDRPFVRRVGFLPPLGIRCVPQVTKSGSTDEPFEIPIRVIVAIFLPSYLEIAEAAETAPELSRPGKTAQGGKEDGNEDRNEIRYTFRR